MRLYTFYCVLINFLHPLISASVSISTSDLVISGSEWNASYYGIDQRRAKSYIFVNVKESQNTALINCMTDYGGRLLTILSQEEDNLITGIIVSRGITDDIITAGKYNQYKEQWEWSTTAAAFVYDNFAPSIDLPNYCCFKTVQQSNSYRWRGRLCTTNSGVYFCEVGT